MRNRLIHPYFDIDYDVAWQALKYEVPKLIPEIKQLLEEGEQQFEVLPGQNNDTPK